MPDLYRVEHRLTQQSLWYTPSGIYEPTIFKLKADAKAKHMPMGFDPDMLADGKRWISCTQSIPALACVFGSEELDELEANGYGLFHYNVNRFRSNAWHDLFTREDVNFYRQLDMQLVKDAFATPEV